MIQYQYYHSMFYLICLFYHFQQKEKLSQVHLDWENEASRGKQSDFSFCIFPQKGVETWNLFEEIAIFSYFSLHFAYKVSS